MAFLRIRQEIEQYFFTEFDLVNPTVPVTGENADFEPPQNEPWIRLAFQVADEFEVCIGNNISYRTEGVLTVQIFVPLSTGTALVSQLADDVLTIFRKAGLADMIRIAYLNSTVTFNGQNDGYYQVNILVSYRAED